MTGPAFSSSEERTNLAESRRKERRLVLADCNAAYQCHDCGHFDFDKEKCKVKPILRKAFKEFEKEEREFKAEDCAEESPAYAAILAAAQAAEQFVEFDGEDPEWEKRELDRQCRRQRGTENEM